VALKGNVDKYAPVDIVGQINPLSGDRYTDLLLSFKNMELTTMTPYSGKFAGYTIKKGKLSLDLKYKLSENVLIGENKIVADQLTLGERVESPDATSLPVKLAIALLKDRHGKIDLDVPVRGDLNDPEFSVGPIVVQALVNVVTKIVTSPFALLGSLIGGGGEELSFVDFEVGSSALAKEEIEKLDKLAKALNERPALQLEIKAVAHKESDRAALAESALLDQLKQAKLKEMQAAGKQAPAQAKDVSLSDDDYARLITQAYEKRFGKHPSALLGMKVETSAKETQAPADAGQSAPASPAKPAQAQAADPQVVIAMAKKRLIEDMGIDDTRLRILAQERAKQIKGYLLEKGKIPEEQLFIVDVELGGSSDGDTVRANLSLSAS
jgi:hypothetical protein